MSCHLICWLMFGTVITTLGKREFADLFLLLCYICTMSYNLFTHPPLVICRLCSVVASRFMHCTADNLERVSRHLHNSRQVEEWDVS